MPRTRSELRRLVVLLAAFGFALALLAPPLAAQEVDPPEPAPATETDPASGTEAGGEAGEAGEAAGEAPGGEAIPDATPVDAPPPPALTLEEALARIVELEDELALLRAERDAMEEESLAILAEISRLTEAAEASESARQVAEAESALRAAEIVALEAQVEELETRIAGLEAARGAAGSSVASTFDIDRSLFTETLKSGFSGARPLMGTWSLSSSTVAQTDPRQYFSRLSLALAQERKPVLYAFSVKAGAEGWVGAGLHFFVSGVRSERGYGEGKSLLFWLTRDPKARGSSATWLQLYRSDDDVNMERVLDAKLEKGIAEWRRVEILYDPAAEFVAVAVDGQVKAAYRTFFGLGSGVSVSLRTLGAGVSFKDFSAKTTK